VDEVAALISTPEMRGTGVFDLADKLSKHYGVESHPPAWLAKRKKEVAVEQALSGNIDFAPLWFEGVPEAVAKLADKMGPEALALCTSNLRPIVEATLEAGPHAMSRTFLGGCTVQEDVITGGVNRMKPKAYPYERALRLLGSPPARTLVIEDSVVGVSSAAKAGAGVVLAVLNPEHAGAEGGDEATAASALHAAGADGVFRNTTDAIAWAEGHVCTQEARITAAAAEAEAAAKEAVVRRYFAGVNAKDRASIRSCFADTVHMRDMCGISKGAPREASADDMADRCMEFVAAHPDVRVFFESPPCCDRNGEWVWAHWAEDGTWSGESKGLAAGNTPLDVSGHTRFYLEDHGGQWKIARQVVYRTFSDWERALTGL